MTRRFLFVALTARFAFSQSRAPEELKFSVNGASVAIHTRSTGAQSPVSTSGAISIDNGRAPYRIVVDGSNRPLFAYELELRKWPPDRVKVSIRPADQDKLRAIEWLKGRIATDEVPTISSVRSFPPLRLGDEVHVDIMHNPKTGETLSDVLRIVPNDEQSAKLAKVHTGPQFSWEGVVITIDGKLVADRSRSWMIGEAIAMHVPGRGAYYMAVRPPAGFPFQPAGRVEQNVLRFQVNGEQVQITGKSNLLMKSNTGTVWIYHVPEARTKVKADSLDITCTDVDLLMPPGAQRD